MIKLINMAKVKGNFDLLCRQIETAYGQCISSDKIAKIFEVDKKLIDLILLYGMPEDVSEDQGLALLEANVSVEFYTKVLIAITTEEELFFYNLLFEENVRDAFFVSCNASYPINKCDFVNELEAAIEAAKRIKNLKDLYNIDSTS